MNLRVRLQLVWMRLKSTWQRFWINPAPAPEQIGKAKPNSGHRPVAIELAFYLHADGKVYQRQRSGDGDRRIDNEEVIAMVRREYRILVEHYRKLCRKKQILARLRALPGKALDTTKEGGLS